MLFLPILAKGERDVWWLLCYTSWTPSALRRHPLSLWSTGCWGIAPILSHKFSSTERSCFLLIWPLLGFDLFSWVVSVLWLMDAGVQMPGYFASICNSSDGPSSFTASEGLAESFTANCLMVQLLSVQYCSLQCLTGVSPKISCTEKSQSPCLFPGNPN